MTSKKKEQIIIASTLIVSVVIFMWAINGTVSNISRGFGSQDMNDSSDTTLKTPELAKNTTPSTAPAPENPPTTLAKRKPKANATQSTMPDIKCYSNTDCGDNGTAVSKEYTCYDGGINRQYISFKCVHPGTAFAECVGQEKMELIKQCGVNEGCIDGEWYCQYLGPLTYVNNNPQVPKDASFYGLSNNYQTYHNNYQMQIVYIMSENSKPRGVTIDLFRPDGTESWEFIYERGSRIDNMTIGYTELYNTGTEIRAKAWISDMV